MSLKILGIPMCFDCPILRMKKKSWLRIDVDFVISPEKASSMLP
jgi:hypothetical protein